MADQAAAASQPPDDLDWQQAFPLEELSVGAAKLFRDPMHQIAVFRVSEEEIYAVDNQCPHEGYPLVKGGVQDCSLTCIWHNYKFDLKTGKCLKGDEDVRSYPVRVHEGMVELALQDPDPREVVEARAKSLKEAMQAGRPGQAARDLVRMLAAGAEPERVALEVAAFDTAHGEYGPSHALPVAVDATRISTRYVDTKAALPLMHAVDLTIDANKHRVARRPPASKDPGRDPDEAGQQLLQLVRDEDAEGAEGLLRGILWRKWGRDVIEPWFLQINAEHFLNFGHGLIYTIKAFDLLQSVGFDHARRVLPGLMFGLVNATREDQLPEWDWFRQRYAALEPRLPELWERAGARDLDQAERDGAARAILDGSREEAWHAVIGMLASGARVDSVLDVLSRSAAERVWRFDTHIDGDITVQDGWLNVTHPLTYAHALRFAAHRFQRPEFLRMLLFGVRFVNNAKPLDRGPEQWTAVDAKGMGTIPDRDRLLDDLCDCIAERDPIGAQRYAIAYMRFGGELDAMRARIQDLAVRDLQMRPIFVGHAIKLAVACFDEASALPERDRTWPVRAMVRMLASPMSQRIVERLVHEARRLVETGQVPKTLT